MCLCDFVYYINLRVLRTLYISNLFCFLSSEQMFIQWNINMIECYSRLSSTNII